MKFSLGSTNRMARRPITAAMIAIVVALLSSILMASPAQAKSPDAGFPTFGTHNIPANPAKCAIAVDGNVRNSGECVVSQIESFLQNQYNGTTVRPTYRAVMWLAGGTVIDPVDSCFYGYGLVNYCAVNNFVYVGMDNLWPITNGGTKVGVAAIFAHELGHHLQTEPRAGGQYSYAGYAGPEFEDQADCVSGAFFNYGISQGWYTSADAAFAKSLFFPLRNGGGSPGEVRTAMFQQGLDEGLSGCVRINPDHPIL